MKAILIDSVERTITEVDYNGDWQTIGPTCGYDYFEIVNITDDGTEGVYVDEEGLYKEHQHFFRIGTYQQPLAGNGLILGHDHDSGDSVATKLSVADVENMVYFLGELEVEL